MGHYGAGCFITFRLLDFADLTVDGSFATGGAVTVVLILSGVPALLALITGAGTAAGLITVLLHTRLAFVAIAI